MKQQDGKWHTTGPLPSIDLSSSRANLPSGWVRLHVDIDVARGDSALGWMRAYKDADFSEAAAVCFPRKADGKVRTIVRLPDTVRALRYEPIKGQGVFALGRIEAQEIGRLEVFVRQMMRYCRDEDISPASALRAAAFHVRIHGLTGLWKWMKQYLGGDLANKAYGSWARQHDSWTPDGLRTLERTARELAYRPKFSIVMPVHDTPERWLRKAIDSIAGQAYQNWELCICDDNSAASHIPAILDAYSRADARIKITRRAQRGYIARATNDAMGVMTGDFMCLMDHDDALAPHALFEFAKLLNEDASIDLIYSDEDLITIDDVRCEPIIKPAWSPENLESYMYVGHLACFRADQARRIGGFRPEYSGAQDYDFALRYTEQAANIRHVPKVLYHWRAVPGSVAVSIENKVYVVDAAKRALEQKLLRYGDTGSVAQQSAKGWFDVRRDVIGSPLVSLIVFDGDGVATRGGYGVGQAAVCVESIRSKTTYPNYEVIVAPGAGSGADRLNEAVARANGDYLVFMDGGCRVISSDWLQSLLRYAQRPGVGAVGAKLLFGDDTIRHVGIVFAEGLPRHVRQGYPASDRGYWGSSAIARNFLAVSGACMMVGREVFSSAGGFDSTLAAPFFYFDLCLKMVENGCRNVYVPSASLYHLRHGNDSDDVAAAEEFRKRWLHLTDPDPFYGANLDLNPPTFAFDPVHRGGPSLDQGK